MTIRQQFRLAYRAVRVFRGVRVESNLRASWAAAGAVGCRRQQPKNDIDADPLTIVHAAHADVLNARHAGRGRREYLRYAWARIAYLRRLRGDPRMWGATIGVRDPAVFRALSPLAGR
jgi:hypothetical protein